MLSHRSRQVFSRCTPGVNPFGLFILNISDSQNGCYDSMENYSTNLQCDADVI